MLRKYGASNNKCDILSKNNDTKIKTFTKCFQLSHFMLSVGWWVGLWDYSRFDTDVVRIPNIYICLGV